MYDMLAINYKSGEQDFARVMVQRIDMFKAEETYALFRKLVIPSVSEDGITDIIIDSGEMMFLGESHPWASYSGKKDNDAEIYNKSVHVRHGDYLLTFTAVSAFQDFTDDILSNFYSVNA